MKSVNKSKDKRRESIVLVDDSRLILSFLLHYLEKDFEVNAFTSAVEAIKYINSGVDVVDCVITDYNIPNELNGMELLDQLKEEHPSLPVVFLSGSVNTKVKVDCIQRGARDFISKPFNPTELVARIHSIINQSSRNYEPAV